MKTAIFTIEGVPSGKEMLVLSYTTPRGGMSNATYRPKGERREVTYDDDGQPTDIGIKSAETPEQIAGWMAKAVNESKDYCPEQFRATSMADMLVVTCSDGVSDVTFIPQVQGESALTFAQVS